jgi:hypothetical protein
VWAVPDLRKLLPYSPLARLLAAEDDQYIPLWSALKVRAALPRAIWENASSRSFDTQFDKLGIATPLASGCANAGMAELADALDLGSPARYPHQGEHLF